MLSQNTIQFLQPLLSGAIDMVQFESQLQDVLFDLRQDPLLTEDRAVLGRLQLYLHEYQEGSRDLLEVYMAAQGALDTARRTFEAIENKTEVDLPYSPSQLTGSPDKTEHDSLRETQPV